MPGPSIAIVGAGMSGLCAATKLRTAGFDDLVIYEKAAAVGGTWRENTYPGLSCDVPSRFYSYSFAPNPGWSSYFSPGAEIQRYFVDFAERSGLLGLIRFEQEVVSARREDGRWRLRTRGGGERTADVLVCACGVLHHPRTPELPGLEDFAGAAFHSARWDHDTELRGKRVGIVGTGSTGVQIACALAPEVERLEIFQRTAQWILPVPNRRYSRLAKPLLSGMPRLNRWSYELHRRTLEIVLGRAVVQDGWQRRLVSAICRLNLRRVRDPELRRRLTPDYAPMCKRLVMSAGFYRAVQRPNVDVVADAIERIEPAGVRTRDGRLHELDVLVLATGFDAHAYMRPMAIEGEGGVSLEETWAERPHAYRTVAIPGFPNLFTIMGPHSPIGNQSLIAVAEAQVDYVIEWMRLLRDRGIAAAAPTAEATAEFNDALRAAMPATVFATGCQSWYLGPDGLPDLWPWTPGRHRAMLRAPELAHFDVQYAPEG